MENKNQPINQNPDNNNQGENPASSSGNNPALNEQEKAEIRAQFVVDYSKIMSDLFNENFPFAD